MMKKLLILRRIWQKTKKEQSAFSVTKKEDCVSLPTAPSQSLCTFHPTCKTLFLDPFIQAYCNGDFSFIYPNVSNSTPLEIQCLWNEIMFEWACIIKTENSQYLFDLSKQIGLLQHHIIYIDYAIIFLLAKYDEDIADQVRLMGYDVPEISSPGYQSAINRIKSLAKTKVFELNGLTDDYNRLNNTATGKSQSEEEFISLVLILAKYQGYNIDRKATTVYDFAQIFNNYLAEMKIKETQLETYKK